MYTPEGKVSGIFKFESDQTAVSGSYTPQGSITIDEYTPSGSIESTFEGDSVTISVTDGFPHEDNATYIPKGSINTPDIVSNGAGSTATINNISNLTLPTLTMTIDTAGEEGNLRFSWDQGKFDEQTVSVKTGDANYKLKDNIQWTGTPVHLSAEYQPSGTVAATFNGESNLLTGSFTGTAGSIDLPYTPAGTVTGDLDFTGTKKQIDIPAYTPTGTIRIDRISYGETPVVIK